MSQASTGEQLSGLAGMKVIEIGSIDPGPFCAMVVAELNADIIRVGRVSGTELVGPAPTSRTETVQRDRRSVGVDLNNLAGGDLALVLAEQADALIEGFRRGVAERLGIGQRSVPTAFRGWSTGVTGFRQERPMSQTVGYKLSYIAQSGMLSLLGRSGQPPTPLLNLAISEPDSAVGNGPPRRSDE